MRRNYTESDALSSSGWPSSLTDRASAQAPNNKAAAGSPMRRNISASTLCELRRRENLLARTDSRLEGSRAAVVEAVACVMLEHMLGPEQAHAAMRASIAAKKDGGEGGGEKSGGGGGQSASVSSSLQSYILTIVRHLELPNSCIVASLIYVQRAVQGTRFQLTLTNWQPCLLAAFVIAAKLSFDEPVWNEDFVKALRISNVQVCQISRWEADFLQLLSFNTNVTVAQYAACCFRLQKAHEALHNTPCRFFTFLMALSGPEPPASGAAS